MTKHLRLLLFTLIFLPLTGYGEGSKQLTPNRSTDPLTSATNDRAGYLSHDANFPSGTGVQVSSLGFLKPSTFSRNGATFSADHRLYVRVKSGETLHYGVRRALHDQTTLNQGDLTITVRRVTATSGIAGDIVQSHTLTRNQSSTRHMLLNTNQAGVIATPTQALAGPNRSGVTTGYNSLSLINNTGATQDYFVEFTQVGESTLDDGQRFSVYDLWDFTVINQQNEEKTGRLHSKLWSFSAGGATNVFSKDFNMFPLVPSEELPSTFYVKKLELAGMAPQNFFRFVTNRFGSTTSVGTTVEARRRSQNSQTDYPEFFNFVNNPDPEFWPSADAPSFTVAITSSCNANGGGKSIFYINSSVRSTFLVLIDLNGTAGYQVGTTDVLLESTGEKGARTLEWNGRDGQGGTVASGRTLTYQFKNGSAPVHFPMWDAEWNDGFRVEDVRPLVGSNYNGLLYWDDINISSSVSSTDFPVQRELFGVVSTAGVHRWGSSTSAAGDVKTINTWTYGYTNTSSQTAVYTYSNCNTTVDVGVVKTATGPYALGVPFTFTLTASNLSTTLSATGVKIIDQINTSQFEFISASPSVGTFSIETGTWDIGTLAANTSRTLTLTVRPKVTGAVSNTATQSHIEPDGTTTTAINNNTSTVNVTVLPAADIQVANTVNQSTFNNGDLITYTLTASNNGPSVATGVTITDKLPSGLILEGTLPAGYAAETGLWTVGTLAVGETRTITLTARASQLGSITTTATLGSRSGFEYDAVSNNNTASNTITVNASADVAVTNTVSSATGHQGEPLTFTIVAANNGPNNATNVVVNTPIPAGLNIVGSQASLGSYSAGVWTVGTILPGTSQTLTLTAKPTGTGQYVLVATQTHLEFDRVSSNNSASATVTVAATADVAITNIVTLPTGPNDNYQGKDVTYRVVVSNNGPSSATNVVVTDQLPSGSLTFVSASTTAGTGTYNPVTGVWAVGTLATGQEAVLTIVARVATGRNVITTTATQTHTEFDNVSSNNSASATFTSIGGVVNADIQVSLTKTDGPYATGKPVTFTVKAENLGADAATNLKLESLVPAGFTLVSATPAAGTYNSATGEWNIGNLAYNASTELVLVAVPKVNLASTGDINYTMTARKVSATEGDSNTSNNTAQVSLTVQKAVDPAVTVSVTGDVNGVYYRGLTEATFTLVVTNNGPDKVTNLVGADTRTGNIQFTYVEPGKGYDPNTGIWNIAELGAGQSVSLQVKGIPLVTGRLFLGGSITSQDQKDTELGNNRAVALLTVVPVADLSLNITPAAGPYYNQQNTTFTVEVKNNSADATSGVKVDNLLPAGLRLESFTVTNGTFDAATGLWTLSTDVLPGSTETLVLTTKPTTNGTYTLASAIKTSTVYDNITTNNSDTETIEVLKVIDVAVSSRITQGPYRLGQPITVTLEAINFGPNAATGVILAEYLPEGVTLSNAFPAKGTYVNGIWNIGTLGVNESTTLVLTLTPTTAGTKTNIITKTSAVEYDANGGTTANGNNSSTLSFIVGDQAATYAVSLDNLHFYKFRNENVIAVATDLDGTITSAEVASGSLPAGVVLGSNGYITVEDRFKIRPGTYTLQIRTTDNFGSISTTPVTFTITADWDGDGVADMDDTDDNNDGISDVLSSRGVDPFGIQVVNGVASPYYNYSNPTYVHPVYGAFRDLNRDGINDWFDIDMDGIINSLDVDMDGDGITNVTEANGGKNPSSTIYNHGAGIMLGGVNTAGVPLSSLNADGTSIFAMNDTDGDGLRDFLDIDSDNDGILDFVEAQRFSVGKPGYRYKSPTDTNQNGLNDAFDVADGGVEPFIPVDTDATLINPDGVPDYLDLDSDNDFVADYYEAHDSNLNGVALDDYKRLAEQHSTLSGSSFYSTKDSNGNGTPDWLEKSAKGIPNFLDPSTAFYKDSDQDGLVDLFDADSFGSEAVPAQKDAATAPSFRNNGEMTPLPVTLISFTAKLQKEGVMLNWTTATEKDNDYFQVERSTDGRSFTTIGKVTGAGTTLARQDYRLLDTKALTGTTYYRLKQVDYDGKFEYSKIVAVQTTASAATQVTVLAYPNPTTDAVSLDLTLVPDAKVTIAVYALDGRLLMTTEAETGGIQKLDLTQVAVGTYLVKIKGTSFETVTRIIKR